MTDSHGSFDSPAPKPEDQGSQAEQSHQDDPPAIKDSAPRLPARRPSPLLKREYAGEFDADFAVAPQPQAQESEAELEDFGGDFEDAAPLAPTFAQSYGGSQPRRLPGPLTRSPYANYDQVDAAPRRSRRKKLVPALLGALLIVALAVFWSSDDESELRAPQMVAFIPANVDSMIELPDPIGSAMQLNDVAWANGGAAQNIESRLRYFLRTALHMEEGDASDVLASIESIAFITRADASALLLRFDDDDEALALQAALATIDRDEHAESTLLYLLTSYNEAIGAPTPTLANTCFNDARLLAIGAPDLVQSVDAVVLGGEAALDQEEGYLAAKEQWLAGASVVSYAAPSLNRRELSSLEEIERSLIGKRSNAISSTKITEHGFVSHSQLTLAGDMLPPQELLPSAGQFKLPEQLPADTLGYAAWHGADSDLPTQQARQLEYLIEIAERFPESGLYELLVELEPTLTNSGSIASGITNQLRKREIVLAALGDPRGVVPSDEEFELPLWMDPLSGMTYMLLIDLDASEHERLIETLIGDPSVRPSYEFAPDQFDMAYGMLELNWIREGDELHGSPTYRGDLHEDWCVRIARSGDCSAVIFGREIAAARAMNAMANDESRLAASPAFSSAITERLESANVEFYCNHTLLHEMDEALAIDLEASFGVSIDWSSEHELISFGSITINPSAGSFLINAREVNGPLALTCAMIASPSLRHYGIASLYSAASESLTLSMEGVNDPIVDARCELVCRAIEELYAEKKRMPLTFADLKKAGYIESRPLMDSTNTMVSADVIFAGEVLRDAGFVGLVVLEPEDTSWYYHYVYRAEGHRAGYGSYQDGEPPELYSRPREVWDRNAPQDAVDVLTYLHGLLEIAHNEHSMDVKNMERLEQLALFEMKDLAMRDHDKLTWQGVFLNGRFVGTLRASPISERGLAVAIDFDPYGRRTVRVERGPPIDKPREKLVRELQQFTRDHGALPRREESFE